MVALLLVAGGWSLMSACLPARPPAGLRTVHWQFSCLPFAPCVQSGVPESRLAGAQARMRQQLKRVVP